MRIPDTSLIRQWEAFTLEQEKITSPQLMERAASACAQWILAHDLKSRHFICFCGTGNNGGDGLIISRILCEKGYEGSIIICGNEGQGSAEFLTQFNLIRQASINTNFVTDEEALQIQLLQNIHADTFILDALLGIGISRPATGIFAVVIKKINSLNNTKIAIDIPSGLYPDQTSKGNIIIEADFTLTIQTYKMAFLMQENSQFMGNIQVIDIQLSKDFPAGSRHLPQLSDRTLINSIYKPRKSFAHKGNHGKALIMAGSYGKMGAALLATQACVTSGAGLTTAYIPHCGYVIMQSMIPEAMVITDPNEKMIAGFPDELEHYAVIGIGPGIGVHDQTQNVVSYIIRRSTRPLVIDADALNCIGPEKELLNHLPPLTIITPHPKEFDRLFGEHEDDFARKDKAIIKAKEFNIIIVLKGHHTQICTPDGGVYFNTTGNAGLAKGGSGDVLTGIITALVAQQYKPAEAAIFGVYLHGLAADLAIKTTAMESLTASELISNLSLALKEFNNKTS